MSAFTEAWHEVVRTPLFGITLTVAAYALAVRLFHRAGRNPLLTPVLVAMALVVAFLALTGIDYADYMRGGQYLSFLLGPATVALAIPLYRSAATIKRLLLPVIVGVLCGSIASMVSAVLLVRWFGGSEVLEITMAPKSTTTPIAIALVQGAGGLPSLAAVVVILTGVLGAVVGSWVLDVFRVRDPRIRGLAIGVSSHGVGTAKALQIGPTVGAFSALAMALSGIITALLMPAVLLLLS